MKQFKHGSDHRQSPTIYTLHPLESRMHKVTWGDVGVAYYSAEDASKYFRIGTWIEHIPTFKAEPERSKYHREIKPGVWVDVYDVINAFEVTDAALQHLLKKALATGQRGHKDTREDLQDIVDSAKRALEDFDVWNTK